MDAAAENDTSAMVATKTCTTCEMVKPITAFSKDKRDKKCGVRHSCRECVNKSASERRTKKKQVDGGN